MCFYKELQVQILGLLGSLGSFQNHTVLKHPAEETWWSPRELACHPVSASCSDPFTKGRISLPRSTERQRLGPLQTSDPTLHTVLLGRLGKIGMPILELREQQASESRSQLLSLVATLPPLVSWSARKSLGQIFLHSPKPACLHPCQEHAVVSSPRLSPNQERKNPSSSPGWVCHEPEVTIHSTTSNYFGGRKCQGGRKSPTEKYCQNFRNNT